MPHKISKLGHALRLVMTAALLGIVVATIAAGFVSGIAAIGAWGAQIIPPITIAGVPFYAHLLPSLAIAAAAILIVKRISTAARWYGPADSILAAHQTQGQLDVKAGFASTIAAFLSAAGGASVGQYGPLVHFGATIAASMRRILGNMPHDIMIGCGVAAAISAGFHAPIAGVIFAHEAVMRHFSIRALGPVVAASVTAASLSEIIMPGASLLHIDGVFPPALHMVLLPALISGLVFGLGAVLFMHSLRKTTAFSAKLPLPAWGKLAVAVCLLGAIGGFFPQAMGLGTKTVADAFAGQIALQVLVLLFVLKIALTSLSLGFGFFGGVFSPAIFTGAMLGGAIGQGLGLIGIVGLAPSLTLAGMAAVAAAVIGAPLATVIITLELTGSYHFALIALLSVAGASLVTHILFGHSFFDRQLLDRGVDLAAGRAQLKLAQTPLRDLAHSDFLAVSNMNDRQHIIDQMIRGNVTESYLVDPNGQLHGKFILPQLLSLPDGSEDSAMLAPDPLILQADDNVANAMTLARDFIGESIPVVDSTGHLCGVISEADLFHAYETAQTQTRWIERD